VNISHATSTGHNFTFRSSSLRGGGGTGPSITIHVSGTMQYNGSPLCIKEVTGVFKRCLDETMNSSSAMRFLRSLCIIREIPISKSSITL